jgi:hypothetical protein
VLKKKKKKPKQNGLEVWLKQYSAKLETLRSNLVLSKKKRGAKDLNIHFTKEKLWVANKYMKRCIIVH